MFNEASVIITATLLLIFGISIYVLRRHRTPKIKISENKIKLEAYFIAEKDGFQKSADEYWQLAKDKITKHNL
jgi:hypothetical protein